MTKKNLKNQGIKTTKIVIEIVCLLFALLTFVSLFLPVIRHQSPDHANVGLGDFDVSAIVGGGLYDNESDKIDPETHLYVKYSKLSEDAQYFYQTFVLLDEGNAGKVFAVFLILCEICGAFLVLSVLLALLADIDAFAIQTILGVLQIAFSVAVMLCVPKLSSMAANTEFITLNFVVLLRPAVFFILASGVGFAVCSLVGWLFTSKRRLKG